MMKIATIFAALALTTAAHAQQIDSPTVREIVIGYCIDAAHVFTTLDAEALGNCGVTVVQACGPQLATARDGNKEAATIAVQCAMRAWPPGKR